MVVWLLVFTVAGFFAVRAWLRWRARQQLLSQPLNDTQRRTVAHFVPLTRKLPADVRQKFEGKVNAFLHQVTFQGCDGLEVTEAMRLSIAAQACLLIANIDAWYKNLSTILIYPGAFKSMTRAQQGYVVTERETIRLGESWQHGPVVLSWQHSDAGARNPDDGRNVVFHEFAHQLDGLSGHTDGIPVLGRKQSQAEWEQVFEEAFKTHRTNVEFGHHTMIEPYGAQNYEEFLAVTVELFFEKPKELFDEAPKVYLQLSTLFQLDPRSWSA